MSKKPFRGSAGKSVWENENFKQGMSYTDEALPSGTAKSIVNLDVSKTKGSLEIRDPFYSAAFKFAEVDRKKFKA